MATNKKIFKDALELLLSVNLMIDNLESIGLNVNFDDESNHYSKLVIKPYNIAIAAMDLNVKTEMARCEFSDVFFQIEVMYPNDGDKDFSITEEGLNTLIEKASADETCAELVWDCFVNKDIEAKNTLISDYKAIGFVITQ